MLMSTVLAAPKTTKKTLYKTVKIRDKQNMKIFPKWIFPDNFPHMKITIFVSKNLIFVSLFGSKPRFQPKIHFYGIFRAQFLCNF